MGSTRKTYRIQAFGLALAGLLLSQVVFGLPIEREVHGAPADPAQACILPAGTAVVMAALPLLLSSVPSPPPAEPAGAILKAPGGRAAVRSAASGQLAPAPRPPARDLRESVLCGIPLGAHAPPSIV